MIHICSYTLYQERATYQLRKPISWLGVGGSLTSVWPAKPQLPAPDFYCICNNLIFEHPARGASLIIQLSYCYDFIEVTFSQNQIFLRILKSKTFLNIQDDTNRKAYIGIGFADRSDSFDLNVALQDHFKQVRSLD